MRRLATIWQQLFPVEQCRLAQLLIERVVIADGGLEIVWRDQGWQELAGLHHSTVNELLRLTLLERAVVQSILAGQQPRCTSLLWFQRNTLPTDWVAQREVVAAFDA